MKIKKPVLYYGRDVELPKKIDLKAGSLTAVFENGDLRWIRYGDREIVRRLYAAVRDRNWGTVPMKVVGLSVKQSNSGFAVEYLGEYRQGDIKVDAKVRITGEDGRISFDWQATALSTFLRNRAGFCILHPIKECAGRPCAVEKVDGSVEKGKFPLEIAPHQPFIDMKAISHEVVPGLTAEVRFTGDIFEMEDQRNWTDASYKTYCTPLGIPFPVEVKQGTEIKQRVDLTLTGKAAAPPSATAGALELKVSKSTVPLPPIGIGASPEGGPLAQKEIARLKALKPAFLRIDYRPGEEASRQAAARVAAEAKALGVPLEAAITVQSEADLDHAALDAPIARWLVFHAKEKSTSAKWLEAARGKLKGAPIVGGTNAFFTELNRGRPDVSLIDGACFSVNPQVHAFDNDSLVETLAAHADVVESAKSFLAGKPVHVTPVTFKMRFNPDATGAPLPPPPGELPPAVDPRQMSLFGAAWTLGSIKYLAESGAAAIAYYETKGWKGVMDTEQGSPAPFPAIPGGVFPLYHVLADVLEFAGGEVVKSESGRPLALAGLVLRKAGRTRVLLASYSPEIQSVRLSTDGLGRRVVVKHLDETTAEQAMEQPEKYRTEPGTSVEVSGHWLEITLRPYAVVRIDS